MGCDISQFARLRFGKVSEISSGDNDEIKLKEIYFRDEGITYSDLEHAFVKCTEGNDIYKLALVYFTELVVLGRDKHLNINANYLILVEDLDAFNKCPWVQCPLTKPKIVYCPHRQSFSKAVKRKME
ncbi:unnamed protein product [Prunus armeniaca]